MAENAICRVKFFEKKIVSLQLTTLHMPKKVKKIASVKNRIKNTPVSGAIPKRPLRGRF
jgi:hypothetical protein